MVRDKLRSSFTGDIRQHIKRVALDQLAAGGPAAVSVNAVGRELGVSGPALYRYFASRDELISSLILDAYEDLSTVTQHAVASRRTPRTRRRAFVVAYRQWALADPHRYRLLFRAPLPGFQPNTDQLVHAAQQLMEVLLEALSGSTDGGADTSLDVGPWLAARALPTSQTANSRLAMALWPRLHGLVSLEIEDCFESMNIDPTPLYASEFAL